MAYQVGVVGASGYGGAELLRLLDGHPALDVAVVAAGRHAGTTVDALFPNLPTGRVYSEVDAASLRGLDLVFLATPAEVSLELTPDLLAAGVAVVDLSAAFRLTADGYEQWYGTPHPHPELTPATYGLTEWNRDAVRDSRLVANPGCYPTAALLGLLPLSALIDPHSVVITAGSGTSGAGRGLRDDLHHPHVHGDVTVYGAPRHRHTGEIEWWWGELSGGGPAPPVSFTPQLLPMARGLIATIHARLGDGVDPSEVQDALRDRYHHEPFVRVLPEGRFPHTKAVHGSNSCQLSATVDPRTGRVVVVSVIDNLGKGAAGQAVQNANLMLGLEETLGLPTIGVYP